MKKKEIIENAIYHFHGDEIHKAFELLSQSEFAFVKEKNTEILQILSRVFKLDNNERKGIRSTDEIILERNIIRESCFSFISELIEKEEITISIDKIFSQNEYSTKKLEYLKKKKETEDWENAYLSLDINIIENFRSKYPDSRFLLDSEKRISEIKDDQFWIETRSIAVAKKSHIASLKAYRNYIKNTKVNKYKIKAEKEISFIHDEQIVLFP